MHIVRSCLATIRSNLRLYLGLNAAYYLGVLIAALFVAYHPSLQQHLLTNLKANLAHGFLSHVARAYLSGNMVAAALETFLVNSILGAFAWITLPSFLIPFSGMATGFYRAVMWGLTLAPTDRARSLAMIPHSFCLLLEGQAYILAMFGSCLWGKWLIHPSRAGFSSGREAYLAGLAVNFRLYTVILPVLAISAVYESAEVIAVKALLGR
jgi:hypothetical protein